MTRYHQLKQHSLVVTCIDVTVTNAEPIGLGMDQTGRGVEKRLDSSCTYCEELSGGDQMWVDSVAHVYVVAAAGLKWSQYDGYQK